jgi:hypothetical protein
MPNRSVRINEQTRTTLLELASQTNQPMQEVLARAVELYRRQRLLEETNAAYAALRADPQQWREMQAERAPWDAALADNLGPD